MLNKDINSRFQDWLLNPAEALDFEVKRWIDLSEVEAQGLIAKSLIALENHGGGFLLLGYKEDAQKRLVPDASRPSTMAQYGSDSLNAIIKKRAEPPFHVEVTLQLHPETGEEFPLVRAPGTTSVPIRSDSSTPMGALKAYTYYIRAPGPESRGPRNGAEWDALIRRAIMNQRDEIMSVLRNFSEPAVALVAAETRAREDKKDEVLKHYIADALAEWSRLNNGLEPEHPAFVKDGYFYFSARVTGNKKNVSTKDLFSKIESGRRYTGWPVFLVLHKDGLSPNNVDGNIQAWVANNSLADPGHADFWRIRQDGMFFSLRGYQEDAPNSTRGNSDSSGELLEITLPIWRLGEFLLKVIELAEFAFEEGFEVEVECAWTGLRGRKLYSHNFARYVSGYVSASDQIVTQGYFAQTEIRDLLPDVVRTLTQPLYEVFEFFVPPPTMFNEELSKLSGRTF